MTFATHKIATDGSHGASLENDRRIKNTTQLPFLTRGVVVEVFYDMSLVTEELKEDLRDRVQNANAIDMIRRNCLLIEEISGETSRSLKPIICLPLLDPYISLPFKPGETVLIIREDQYGAPDEIPFVLCRVPSAHHVDDVNYTHDDRKFLEMKDSRDAEDKKQSITSGVGTNNVVDFQNGKPDDDSYTIGSTKDEYDKIWNESIAAKQVVLEPVPRFSKRPGDQILQGSNNTLINFTTERVGSVTNSVENAVQRGAIDIVVGRGLTPTYQPNEKTSPIIVNNTRNAQEVDKTPHLRNKEDVATEGDPDFENDPSRIYVAIKTDVDKNFAIDIQNINEPPVALRPPTEKPAIAIKTNQLRLIGRDDIKIQADNGDGLGASIVIKSNGDVLITPGTTGQIVINQIANPITVSQGSVELGNAPQKGVARQDDTIAPNDAMTQWMTQVTTELTKVIGAINALAPGAALPITAQPPSNEIGAIATASEIVKSV